MAWKSPHQLKQEQAAYDAAQAAYDEQVNLTLSGVAAGAIAASGKATADATAAIEAANAARSEANLAYGDAAAATLAANAAIRTAEDAQHAAAELTTRLTKAEQVISRPRPPAPVVVEQRYIKEPGVMGRITGATQYLSDGTTRVGTIVRDSDGRPEKVTWAS